MEQRICDVCKKNRADMSFKVKRSNRRWGIANLWSNFETIDVCNECGNKLLGVVNIGVMPPVHPPSSGSSVSINAPTPSYRPPTPPKKDE